jgi:hypothetical protein
MGEEESKVEEKATVDLDLEAVMGDDEEKVNVVETLRVMALEAYSASSISGIKSEEDEKRERTKQVQ